MEKHYEFQENLDNLSRLICKGILYKSCSKHFHIPISHNNHHYHIRKMKNCFDHHKVHPLNSVTSNLVEKKVLFQENLDNLSHLICRDILYKSRSKYFHILISHNNHHYHIGTMNSCLYHHNFHHLSSMSSNRVQSWTTVKVRRL